MWGATEVIAKYTCFYYDKKGSYLQNPQHTPAEKVELPGIAVTGMVLYFRESAWYYRAISKGFLCVSNKISSQCKDMEKETQGSLENISIHINKWELTNLYQYFLLEMLGCNTVLLLAKIMSPVSSFYFQEHCSRK